MNYYDKYWIKKRQKIFNYGELIKNVLKCKNLYVNKNGNENSEKTLVSLLKSLNKLYFTNNIYKTIHSKIANHLSKYTLSKKNFKDTLKMKVQEKTIFQEH
jgi:hypothetical protein